MEKYGSIEQFRNVIKAVRAFSDYKGKDEDGNSIYSHDHEYPTVNFKGTVKLHGTNASVVKYKDRPLVYQSRERELSLGADNAGFMTYMSGVDLDFLFEGIEFNEYIAVYGEWCGGNIQSGVAISNLPKMFVVFGLKVDGKWLSSDSVKTKEEFRIYNINQFPTFDVQIDFNSPELTQNRLIELTLEVEEQCPVAKYFGVEGVGEGIVFTMEGNPEFKFKSKGEKHSSSKVKVLNAVNEEELTSIKEFVEYAVTNNRLEQGLTVLKESGAEIDVKNTGAFISWVMKDILKEEEDVIIKNGFEFKKANADIAKKAREFYMSKLS